MGARTANQQGRMEGFAYELKGAWLGPLNLGAGGFGSRRRCEEVCGAQAGW